MNNLKLSTPNKKPKVQLLRTKTNNKLERYMTQKYRSIYEAKQKEEQKTDKPFLGAKVKVKLEAP